MSDATEQLRNTARDIIENYRDNPEHLSELLQFKAKLNLYAYSPRNTVLIHSQNQNVTYVASFGKWKSLGYSIRKNQHGIKILAPAKATSFKAVDKDGKPVWKKLSEATKAEKAQLKTGELETMSKTVFVQGYVFDISQTTCPVEEYPKYFHMGYSSEQHAQIYDVMKQFAEEKGIPVYEMDVHSISLRGNYTTEENAIRINHLLNDTERLSTFIHELSHSFLHNDPGVIDKPRPVIECEADAMSMMIHSRIGLELTDIRKSHFLHAFQSCREIQDFSIEKLLNDVSERFKEFTDELTPAIEQCLSLEAVPEIEPGFSMEMA